jgi:acetoin utilization deacetylase AcuC-like enzyme
MRTGFIFDERYFWHEVGSLSAIMPKSALMEPFEHPDNPTTKRRIRNLLDASGVLRKLAAIAPEPATDEDLLRVHTPDYLAKVIAVGEGGGGDLGMNTVIGRGGHRIAALSAGGVITAVRAVVDGRVDNAYAFVRPAGHHAEPDRAMGFCVFANAAVAAHHALAYRLAERIAIVDFDVHHGNGTEVVFWEEPRVFTVSIHQEASLPFKPGGLLADRGGGAGLGFNLNVPLPPGCGIGAYRAAFERAIIPALHRFKPDLIIVPAGYDAGFQDNLARMMLASSGFRTLARLLLDAAGALCGGKIVFCQEGGYHPLTVPYHALAVFEELAGVATGVIDPYLAFIGASPWQALLPHQENAIEAAAHVVADWMP